MKLSKRARAATAGVIVVLCGSTGTTAAQGQEGGASLEVEEVIVTGRKYRITDVTSATKTNARILDIPQSIQVVSSQIIEDQKPLTIGDIFRNVSGFSAMRNSGETFRALNVRGFNLIDVSVDGLRSTYGLDVQPEGIANIERVEVLKGPAGALYGRGGLGGSVNIVTKRPQRDAHAIFSFATGSGDLMQPTADITGPLNDTGTIRGRLIADYEQRDTPINFVDVERLQVAPSVSFDLGESTLLDLDYDYRKRTGLRFISLPRYGTVIGLNDLRVPFDLFTGEPAQGDTINETSQATGRIEHRFNESWTITAAARWSDTKFDTPTVQPGTLGADNRTLSRRFRRFDDQQREFAADVFISGHVYTGPVGHTFVFGADFDDFTYSDKFYTGSVASLNIAAPVYGAPITNVFQLDDTEDSIGGWGVYLQDQIDLTERLHVMAGVRFDDIEKTRRLMSGAKLKRNDDAISPRIGVSYEVAKGVALFGSYGEGLIGTLDGASNQTGTPFKAGGGEQVEGGVKLDLLDSLSLTLAGFHLTRTGVLVADPSNPPFSMQTGEQESKGVELDATWQASEGLSFMLAYTYIKAEITKNTTLPIGNELRAVPRHGGRVWAKYAFPTTAIGTFAIGAGVLHQDEQFHDETNTLLIPSYTVGDASLFWEIGRYGVQLNVINVTDEEYILRGALSNQGVIPGDPRRFVLTGKVAF